MWKTCQSIDSANASTLKTNHSVPIEKVSIFSIYYREGAYFCINTRFSALQNSKKKLISTGSFGSCSTAQFRRFMRSKKNHWLYVIKLTVMSDNVGRGCMTVQSTFLDTHYRREGKQGAHFWTLVTNSYKSSSFGESNSITS